MADGRIATITGTMLTPGVSLNMRLYTPEVIAKTVARMQTRIADPDGLPLVMRTHHDAGDDSQRIVGRITSVNTDETGAARYAADLYDTGPGRDIAGLVTGKTPALRSVSIHGYWIGPVKRVEYAGQTVETADDLEVDAVDFTATPGVLGAVLDRGTGTQPRETAGTGARTPLREAVDATITALVTEEAPQPAASGKYTARQLAALADRGQALRGPDGQPGWPITNKSELRRAVKDETTTGPHQPAVREHIRTRAHALNLSALIPENWTQDGPMASETTRYSDVREYTPDGGGQAGFSVDAYNGPLSITMRACGIAPADLRAITGAAIDAACDALQALDPDMDADIDVPGAPAGDTDGDKGKRENAPAPPVLDETERAEARTLLTELRAAFAALPQTSPADQAEATPAHVEAPAMGETNQAAETATPTRTLTDTDLAALGTVFAAALKENAAVSAKKAAKREAREARKAAKNTTAETTTAPAAHPVTETATQPTAESVTKADLEALKETLLREATDKARETLLKENGLPPRRGYRTAETDTGQRNEIEDLFADRAEILLGNFARTPAPAANAS